MRTLVTLAITIGTMTVASAAGAASSVILDYVGGSTASMSTGGTSVDANPGDLLSFDVVLDAGSPGIAGLGFDLQWDNATLSLTGNSLLTMPAQAPFAGAPFVSFTGNFEVAGGTGNVPADEDRLANVGFISPFGNATTTGNFGTVVFQVGDGDSLLSSGFFRTDGSTASDGTNFVTPNFSSFAVTVPAPAATASMFAGLLTLALVSLKSRRR